MTKRDKEVAAEQAAAAKGLADRDLRLDYSTNSLDVLTGMARGGEADAAHASYVGEVLLKAVPGGHWTTERRRRGRAPVLRWESPHGTEGPPYWVIDPTSLLRAVADGRHSKGLRADVEGAVEYMLHPTDQNAGALGLRHATVGDRLRRLRELLR